MRKTGRMPFSEIIVSLIPTHFNQSQKQNLQSPFWIIIIFYYHTTIMIKMMLDVFVSLSVVHVVYTVNRD